MPAASACLSMAASLAASANTGAAAPRPRQNNIATAGIFFLNITLLLFILLRLLAWRFLLWPTNKKLLENTSEIKITKNQQRHSGKAKSKNQQKLDQEGKIQSYACRPLLSRPSSSSATRTCV